ncbi:hypothetical protein [Streptomyces sp. NPDC001816]|uniref:hypothetical protein n=1 Tax=Streptomyces sp. NPDC001816 TaxID=3364612 RepID=UPI003680BF1E
MAVEFEALQYAALELRDDISNLRRGHPASWELAVPRIRRHATAQPRARHDPH